MILQGYSPAVPDEIRRLVLAMDEAAAGSGEQ
jgi:hypothetical protein